MRKIEIWNKFKYRKIKNKIFKCNNIKSFKVYRLMFIKGENLLDLIKKIYFFKKDVSI